MAQETSNSLVNLGDLAKPADTLIKKISSAAGILYEPRHIKRIAKAKAKAALIKAQSEIEITDLHRRAANRWIEEEAQRQKNMEDITAKALPQLNENAKPDSVENDWIVNFFDKCRIVSDNEMQRSVVARFGWRSERSRDLLEEDRQFPARSGQERGRIVYEALRVWLQIGDVVPLVFDIQAKIYNRYGDQF